MALFGDTSDSKLNSARRAFLVTWTIIGVAVIIWGITYGMSVLSIPVGILVWTVIIVFVLRGPVNAMEKVGINRTLGTTLAYLLMFIVLGILSLIMFSPVFGLGDQLNALMADAPKYVNGVVSQINDLRDKYAQFLSNDAANQLMNRFTESASDWASSVAKQSANNIALFGSSVASSLIAIGFGLVIAFWVLIELPALGRETRRLAGERFAEDLDMFHASFTRVMGGYIKATVIQCFLIGVMCTIMFMVMKLPSPAALGGITGLLNVIPFIGPVLGGIAAAIVGLFVSPWLALGALVGTLIIQQFVYTFISPRIMGNSVDIHPALILLALMVGSAIGATTGGVIGSLAGMFIAIPAVAVAKSMFVYYFERKTGRRIVAEDGVMFKGKSSGEEELDPMRDAMAPHPGVSASFKPIELDNDGNIVSRTQRLRRIRNLDIDDNDKTGRHS